MSSAVPWRHEWSAAQLFLSDSSPKSGISEIGCVGVLLIYNSFLMHLPLGPSRSSDFFFFFSSTVVWRCHEEMLERMAKKTTVKEVEVCVLLLTALRYHYVTWLLSLFPFVSRQIRSSVQQVLEGLRYLHQKNIAHLDLKVSVHLTSGAVSNLFDQDCYILL